MASRLISVHYYDQRKYLGSVADVDFFVICMMILSMSPYTEKGRSFPVRINPCPADPSGGTCCLLLQLVLYFYRKRDGKAGRNGLNHEGGEFIA